MSGGGPPGPPPGDPDDPEDPAGQDQAVLLYLAALERRRSTPRSDANVAALQEHFLRAAAAYGERHEITYNGWIAAGVDPHVLARAGISVPTD